MTAHVHAENMALYAQDAQETDTPWERWEFKYQHENDSAWVLLPGNPIWDEHLQYRRKPSTINININGFEVPEPCREAPPLDMPFHIPDASMGGGVLGLIWTGSRYHCLLLDRGVVHLTFDAAKDHAYALWSFTAKGSKS